MSALTFGDVVQWTVSNGVERTGIFLAVVPAGEEPQLPEGCGRWRAAYRPGVRLHECATIRSTDTDWRIYAPRLSSVSRVEPVQAEAA